MTVFDKKMYFTEEKEKKENELETFLIISSHFYGKNAKRSLILDAQMCWFAAFVYFI